jgi:hypothetical protein
MFNFTFLNLLGDNSQGQRDATQAELDYLNQGAQAEQDYMNRDAQAEIDYYNQSAQAEQDYYAAQNGGSDWSFG